MAASLHRLCELCKSIKFELHFKEDCDKTDCAIGVWYSRIVSEPITVHSKVVSHHADIAALQTSAANGCHLCTLFSSSITRSEPNYDHFLDPSLFPAQACVSIIYGATMAGGSEMLRIVCDGAVAELDIVDMPWTLGPTKSLFTLFVAATHTSRQLPAVPERPMLAGYPLLGNSTFLHVWRRPKELWLARHMTDPNKPIGWIKPKHHQVSKSDDAVAVRHLPQVWELSRILRSERYFLDAEPDSERIFSQILSWMHTCSHSHKDCRANIVGTLSPRVIDVGAFGDPKEPYLLETSSKLGGYIALSYRWGKTSTLRTTATNYGSHRKAIPFTNLPATLQDAVRVTRSLGQRYLWVDASCIVQDSKPDWEHHAAQMHSIYSQAWLVVSADSAADCTSGFLKPRNVLEHSSCEHPTLLAGTQGRSDKVICPRIPHAQVAVTESVLSTRAWILQERLVSKRNVHWTAHEVFWECNGLVASERQPDGASIPACDVQSFGCINWCGLRKVLQPDSSPTSMNATMLPKARKPLRNLLAKGFSPLPPLLGPKMHAFSYWYHLVEEYSKRSLTIQSDKLPAISGLASAFRRRIHRRNKYVAGHWSGDLLQSLLWRRDPCAQPRSPMEQSTSPTSSCYIAPSFAWSSCAAPILYMPVYTSKEVKYMSEVLDYSTTPVGTDELGQVNNGWIKLRGPTMPFGELYDETFIASGRPSHETGLYFDYPHEVDASNILVLAVRLRRQNSCADSGPFGRRACLLLSPTGESGEYKRIGYYEPEPFLCQGGFKTWQTRVLTII